MSCTMMLCRSLCGRTSWLRSSHSLDFLAHCVGSLKLWPPLPCQVLFSFCTRLHNVEYEKVTQLLPSSLTLQCTCRIACKAWITTLAKGRPNRIENRDQATMYDYQHFIVRFIPFSRDPLLPWLLDGRVAFLNSQCWDTSSQLGKR